MAIYLTSDLHFCHNKDFLYKNRGFNSIQEHNNTIINNWNNTINNDDDIYVLGDIMLNDNDNGIKCLKQLNGKIHIILGNHDTNTRIELYKQCSNVVEIEYTKRLRVHKYNFYLSHYPTLTGNYDENEPLKRKIINLCGHYHCNDKFKDMNLGIIYHVELDAHNMYPISIDNIINDIKNYI